MWTLDAHATVSHWRPSQPQEGATLLFSTRHGGVSAPPFATLNLGRSTADDAAAVSENRSRLLHAAGLDPARLATAGQVHGARVVEVDAPGHAPECDALVSRVPGLALAVTTADCMSLLYHVPGAVAAAHAGWRGLVAGMPVAALGALVRLVGSSPSAATVHFGPCIRGCCYEVGEDVARQFPAEALRPGAGRPHLDLPTAARLALRAAGVSEERIHDIGDCTACSPHGYFSYRRDATRTGRQWGVAAVSE